MKQLSKVVWSEGMHLGPHHFQVQSRFFEEITHFGISKLWFEPYGIVGLELDAEALRNGTVCRRPCARDLPGRAGLQHAGKRSAACSAQVLLICFRPLGKA